MTNLTKNILITGANRGIGLHLSEQLKEKEFNIYALVRKTNDPLNIIAKKVIENIDLKDPNTINNAQEKLKNISFDIIINNAGILQSESLHNLGKNSIDQIMNQFQLNALAPIIITKTFLHQLTKNSKVIFMTSRMGSIADNNSGSRYGYRMSKAALNAAAKSLSIDLKEKNIPVGIFHPGWVKTKMTNFTGNLTPNIAAKQLIERIEELNLENSGVFKHSDGSNLPW